jgi:radical SAM-linked protein
MRPDTFTPELVKSLDSFKRSGLTLAPEAGTKRLRDVINKGMEDEEIVDAIVLAARFRWNLIKLYFMIGLPTETAEDVDAIPRLVERALRAAKSVNHRLSFNVSVSAFTPKPNTPFQWEAQLPMEEMNTRLREVARQTRRFGAKVRWRDPGVSFLEGVLARADRRAGEAIRLAVEKGARLDAWSDCFNLQIWLAAFERLGLSPEAFADARSVNSRLPWDHVRVVDTEFLRQERARAYEGILTEDCRMGTCQSCGVLDETGLDPAEVCLAGVLAGVSDASVAGTLAAPASVPSVGAVQLPGRAIGDSTVATRPSEFRVTGGRYRFQYEKKGKARFLSHLDMVKAFTRALRVSGLPVAYSEGFTRRPKISFGPPLPLGFTGASEYLDVELASAPETDPLAELNRLLPSGVRLLEWKRLEPGSPSLSSSCTTARYRVVFPEHLIAQTGLAPESFRETLATAIHNFDPGARATVGREGSPKQKEVLLGAAIRELSIVGAEPQGSVPQRAARPGGKPQPSGAWLPALDMLLSLSGPDTVRPDDAVVIILSGITLEKKYLQTERKAVYCNDKDGMRPPM